jgi:hypothetical protein
MADDPNVRRVVGPFRSLKAACKFVEKRSVAKETRVEVDG